MTHKDIYTKFMIEYDKANVTSSYPSLTEYEIATVLDKAYNALIAQKVTGNNIRRSGIETDIKAISDLQPLIKTEVKDFTNSKYIQNVKVAKLPNNFLYYINSYLLTSEGLTNKTGIVDRINNSEFIKKDKITNLDHIDPTDGKKIKNLVSAFKIHGSSNFSNMNLDSTMLADTVNAVLVVPDKDNPENKVVSGRVLTDEIQKIDLNQLSSGIKGAEILVWTDTPVKEEPIYVVKTDTSNGNPYDAIINRRQDVQLVDHNTASKFFATTHNMPWIKIPVCYMQDGYIYVVYDKLSKYGFNNIQITYIKEPNKFVKELPDDPEEDISFFENDVEFELNDTMAEELISLAISFALENIESPRLNTKLNMRGLEA